MAVVIILLGIFCQFVSVTSRLSQSDLGESGQTLQCLTLVRFFQVQVVISLQRLKMISSIRILAGASPSLFKWANGKWYISATSQRRQSLLDTWLHIFRTFLVGQSDLGARQCVSMTSQKHQSHLCTICNIFGSFQIRQLYLLST